MKNILYLLLSCLTISCATHITNFRKVTYISKFQTDSNEKPFKKKTFEMQIPKGFTISKQDNNPEFKEVVYVYDDSIKIYITDNIFAGSSLNGKNKLEKGITMIQRKSMQDSIYMIGQQTDNKYWRENILEDVVIGYLNVTKERKADFDKAIESFRRVK